MSSVLASLGLFGRSPVLEDAAPRNLLALLLGVRGPPLDPLLLGLPLLTRRAPR